MRSVCGCTPASSAATEMTNTACVGSRNWDIAHLIGVHRIAQRLCGAALVFRHRLRDLDLQCDEQVARALGCLDAPAAHTHRRARLGPGLDVDLHRATVERRHLDLAAEDERRERDTDRRCEVLAATAEGRV